MTRKMTLAAVLSTALFCGSATLGIEPPTDDQVKAAVQSFGEATKGLKRDDVQAYTAARRDAALAALMGLSVDEMTVDQIASLNSAQIIAAAGKTTEMTARLKTLSADRTASGAKAAAMWLDQVPFYNRRATDEQKATVRTTQREALRAALEHPGLHAALRAGDAGSVFAALRKIDPAVLAELSGSVQRLEHVLTPDLPVAVVRQLRTLVQTLAENDDAFDASTRERLRVRTLAVVKAAQAGADEQAATSLNRAVAYIDGAFARGTLLDRHTPELTVLWSSTPTTIATLDDLKGKVVVVDFWATWCGPCVASFPDVRKLAAHYEGYPVVVLGITSPQGYHISRPEGLRGKTERVDTKGDPQKEFALMPEFIRQMEMTWPVVFTEQDVFNPDYGVLGIPHVAILDPSGVVRHRGLHPSSSVIPWQEKVGKINALLKEFNLPIPPDTNGDGDKTGG